MINFMKRAYTVMEIRTGFATGLPILSGGLYGAYLVGELDLLPFLFFFISGFCFNIVANIAAEIRGYIKNEENEKTLTGHMGSEGLVRGDATLKDAFIVLAGFFVIASGAGLMVVVLTQNLWILGLGVVSAIAAVTYALGPKPYVVYPVGEVVSGLFAGGIASFVSMVIQTGSISVEMILYAVVPTILTVFLMSTNNTSDYDKDYGIRRTLPHVIGFRNSIKIIIPEALCMIAAWTILFAIGGITWWMYIIGLVVFGEFGYRRWYKDYYKVEAVYPEMGRDWGPRPLLLIYSFNIILSIAFAIGLLI